MLIAHFLWNSPCVKHWGYRYTQNLIPSLKILVSRKQDCTLVPTLYGKCTVRTEPRVMGRQKGSWTPFVCGMEIPWGLWCTWRWVSIDQGDRESHQEVEGYDQRWRARNGLVGQETTSGSTLLECVFGAGMLKWIMKLETSVEQGCEELWKAY
jgi:hypothetical protein